MLIPKRPSAPRAQGAAPPSHLDSDFRQRCLAREHSHCRFKNAVLSKPEELRGGRPCNSMCLRTSRMYSQRLCDVCCVPRPWLGGMSSAMLEPRRLRTLTMPRTLMMTKMTGHRSSHKLGQRSQVTGPRYRHVHPLLALHCTACLRLSSHTAPRSWKCLWQNKFPALLVIAPARH